MNENNGTKKREWVKNAIIIFLVIMLLLTFFSNTIMNYSLPEVSAQYARGGNLSEQIRGSGTVNANQVYEVRIDETREIASREVSVGDIVQKGQVLYKLEDTDSEELESARKELEEKQYAYKEMLLESGVDYSIDNLEIANKEEDIALKKEELKDYSVNNKAYEKAKAETKKIQEEISGLSAQSAALESGVLTSLSSEYSQKLSAAKSTMDAKEKSMKSSEEQLKEYESAGGVIDDSTLTSAKQAIESKELEVRQFEIDIHMDGSDDPAQIKQLESLKLQLQHLREDYDNLYSKKIDSARNSRQIKAEREALSRRTSEYNSAKKKYEDLLVTVKNELSVKIDKANRKLEEAKEKESELKAKVTKTPEEYEKEIRDMERDLEKAKLDLAKKQRDDANASGKSSLKIEAQQDAIKACEEKIKKLESKSVGAEITAQVGGKITELKCSAGEEAKQGDIIAKIEMSEKGYTLEMTVTAEQARKVRTGDKAEIMYFWYGDASATLQSIEASPTDPSKSKILKFAVTGDITPGQTLQLSMGAKGQNYDTIVPNSAVREDNNGKFVLVVKAKSSPLGNRYIAERADIEVLASDDTSSAISGAFSGYGSEFIITAATKPIEPGMQVRLVDN